jgi:choline dehydrogenase-like flavoprotein
MFDYLVVEAGFAGATIAERLRSDARTRGADL